MRVLTENRGGTISKIIAKPTNLSFRTILSS